VFHGVKLSVKVKLFVLCLLCVCAILPSRAVPEMTYTVSDGMLNPTYSLTHSLDKLGNFKVVRVKSDKIKVRENWKKYLACF